MMANVRSRGFLPALVLSAGLHGLLVLVVCGNALTVEVAPAPGKPADASVPYARRLSESGACILRSIRSDVPPPEVRAVEVFTPPEPPPVTLPAFPVPVAPVAGYGSGPGNAGVPPPGTPGNGGTQTVSGLFAGAAGAGSLVFVVDRSLSMGVNGGLRRARGEVSACLAALPTTACFQVVPYDDAPRAEPLTVDGSRGLLPAEPAVVAAALAQVDALRARGGTNHLAGLTCGLALRPEVLYLVTDADDFEAAQATVALRSNPARTRIHVVHLTVALDRDDNLRRLAVATGGTYRRLSPDAH